MSKVKKTTKFPYDFTIFLAIYEQFWHNSFGSSLIINFKRLDIKPLIALEKRLMEASRMGFFIFVWRGISLLLNVF
jgi:hypothetical protein